MLVSLLLGLASAPAGSQSTTSAPPSPARERLTWLVGQMNSDTASEASITAGFAPRFLAAIPFPQLATVLVSVVGNRTGWRVVDDRGVNQLAGYAVLASSDGTKADVTLYVEPDGEHRITGLRIALAKSSPPITAETFDASFQKLGPIVAFGLYDITKGDCRLVYGVNAKQVMPIASTFKLWVLAALGTEIQSGRASWDETMKVQRALISTPNGEIANAKPGTNVSLRRLAELMISVSDNSATDHLLHRVGRVRVEEAMRNAGVAASERNIPMLSTREVFLIKRGTKVPAETYLKLDIAGRRKALDTLAGITWADDPRATQNTNTPASIDTIEWFASPLDQCRTQLRLADLGSRKGLGPIADILRKNPGTQFGPEWTDVRFKGGSEAGVLFVSWRLVAKDGRVFVMAGGVANPNALIDEATAIATIAAGTRFVSAA
jgi:beta-lactamase class A